MLDFNFFNTNKLTLELAPNEFVANDHLIGILTPEPEPYKFFDIFRK